MELFHLTASEAAASIAAGEFSAEKYAESCIGRIKAFEEDVQAWIQFDPDHLLHQAREADRIRQSGRAIGPLHGIPVGIKDLFDTKGIPTAAGTTLHEGRTPYEDAVAVGQLRQAGAIVAGKTVTVELAFGAPGKTRNPHDPERTPGGSSSGSAASVAAYMVPLAIGTQTAGSIIRPASFCGIYGYVPTRGTISRHRMLKLSPTLDRVGVFGRSVADVALLAQNMMGFDDRDSAMSLRAQADLTGLVGSEPPVKLHFACVKTTAWDKAEPATLEAFGELVDHLGDRAAMIELSDALERVEGWFRTVQLAELAHSIAPAYEAGHDKLSEGLCKLIDEGQSISAHDYLHAVDRMTATGSVIADVLADYDAILTPAALGEAPKGLASAGDPVLSEIWSYCGLPAISLPILKGPAGLPLGVQMIAGRFDDARLLRNASWLLQSVEE